MTTLRYCVGCFKLRQENNRLRAENERLKAQLRAQKRSAREGAFGASTPSAKIPIKPNTLADRQGRRGGGTVGHAGHGRATVSEAGARTRETLMTILHTLKKRRALVASTLQAALDPYFLLFPSPKPKCRSSPS